MRTVLLLTLLLLQAGCALRSESNSQVENSRVIRGETRPAATTPGRYRDDAPPAHLAPVRPSGNSGATTLLEQAAQARQRGDLVRAQSLAERAQALDSRSGYSYLELARIYLARGDHNRARQMALRGLNHAGDDTNLRAALNSISNQ